MSVVSIHSRLSTDQLADANLLLSFLVIPDWKILWVSGWGKVLGARQLLFMIDIHDLEVLVGSDGASVGMADGRGRRLSGERCHYRVVSG